MYRIYLNMLWATYSQKLKPFIHDPKTDKRGNKTNGDVDSQHTKRPANLKKIGARSSSTISISLESKSKRASARKTTQLLLRSSKY